MGTFTTAITVAAWDEVLNIPGFGAVPVDAPLTLPEAGVSTGGGGSSLDYFVRFTLSDGSTLTVNGDQLMALQDFSFGDEIPVSIGSATGGAGAGKVKFDPLELTFSQPDLDPQLFKMLAEGSHFKEVDVLGYHAGADGSHLAVDYSFGTVFPDRLDFDGSGKTHLELQYGAEEIQQFDQNPDGSSRPGPVAAGSLAEHCRGFSSATDRRAADPCRMMPAGASSLDLSVHETGHARQRQPVCDWRVSRSAKTPSASAARRGGGRGRVTLGRLQPARLVPQLFKTLAQGCTSRRINSAPGLPRRRRSGLLIVDYGTVLSSKAGPRPSEAGAASCVEIQVAAIAARGSRRHGQRAAREGGGRRRAKATLRRGGQEFRSTWAPLVGTYATFARMAPARLPRRSRRFPGSHQELHLHGE